MRYLLAFLSLIPHLVFGQPPSEWGAFYQKIDVRKFANKRFKLQAAVSVQQIDSTAEAGLWARVDKAGNSRGFFYNMMDRPIRSKEWQIYSFKGQIDKNAEYLSFGGLYFRKGFFFFDDFRLFIETSPDNYNEVDIANGNFEEDIPGGWQLNIQATFFIASKTTNRAYDGKTALQVDGRNAIKPLRYGDNDSTGKFATINGVRMYYEEYGTGSPLLLLHGNGQSINAFSYQIPELAKIFRVIAVDTRGQGKSKEDGKPYTYDLFAADMNALLDHLHLDSVNLIGWSDGGNTGLVMAMKYPDKVKKLVTMGANIFIDNSVVVKGLIPAIRKEINILSKDTSYKARNRSRLMTMLLTEPKYRFEDLQRITCPVLVLAGENDMVKPTHTKTIAANIPNSTLFIAPKENHFFPTQNPQKFNRIVLDYLATAKSETTSR